MVCGTFKIEGVPQAKVKETTALFKANDPPPTSVESAKQDDGTYTITATFPKCPEGTSHSPSGS
jgi:hypothetical protein